MTEKRFFRALFKTMLLAAFLHVMLSTVLFVVYFDPTYLNVFKIIGLSEFFPGIEYGWMSFFVSAGIVTTVFYLFYRKTKSKR